jgi:superfamily II DNA or RNA helicase
MPGHLTPFPYQLTALEELIDRGHLLCGIHPGYGKTPTALMAALLVNGPCIVTCPPGIVGQWKARAEEWGIPSVTTVTTRAEASTLGLHAKVTIIADSMLGSLRVDRLASSLLVIDESHRFKERDTKRTNDLLARTGLARRTRAILALSGTPARNGSEELYPLLSVIAPSIAPDFKTFSAAYCPTYRKSIGGRTVPSNDRTTNAEELNRRLRETILYRPKREDMQQYLPPLRRESHVLPVCVSVMSEAEAVAAFDSASDGVADSPAFSAARRLLGEAKVEAAGQLLHTLVDGGARPIVWCWHQSVADRCADILGCPAIHGGKTHEERRAATALFIAGEAPALVATIGACGTGIDGLQHATDFAIFLERSYVPSDNEQAEGRIYGRADKPQPCRFLILHAADPLDRALDQLLRAKARTLKGMHE